MANLRTRVVVVLLLSLMGCAHRRVAEEVRYEEPDLGGLGRPARFDLGARPGVRRSASVSRCRDRGGPHSRDGGDCRDDAVAHANGDVRPRWPRGRAPSPDFLRYRVSAVRETRCDCSAADRVSRNAAAAMGLRVHRLAVRAEVREPMSRLWSNVSYLTIRELGSDASGLRGIESARAASRRSRGDSRRDRERGESAPKPLSEVRVFVKRARDSFEASKRPGLRSKRGRARHRSSLMPKTSTDGSTTRKPPPNTWPIKTTRARPHRSKPHKR